MLEDDSPACVRGYANEDRDRRTKVAMIALRQEPAHPCIRLVWSPFHFPSRAQTPRDESLTCPIISAVSRSRIGPEVTYGEGHPSMTRCAEFWSTRNSPSWGRTSSAIDLACRAVG